MYKTNSCSIVTVPLSRLSGVGHHFMSTVPTLRLQRGIFGVSCLQFLSIAWVSYLHLIDPNGHRATYRSKIQTNLCFDLQPSPLSSLACSILHKQILRLLTLQKKIFSWI